MKSKTKGVEKTNWHKLRDGRLKIFKQTSTRNWMAQFFAEGKYKVRSLGTENYNEAKQVALDWYDELRFNKKQSGSPIHGIKYKDILERFDKYQKVQIKSGELKESLYKDYKIKLNGALKRYFNNYLLQDIQLKTMMDFREYRVSKDGVKHSTTTHDFVPLRLLLKWCHLQNIIKHLPEFPPKSKLQVSNPRPWFSPKEWDTLKKVAKERIKKGRSKRIRNDRQELYDFMIWIVNTGMRVEETFRVRYEDVEIVKKGKGKKTEFESRFPIRGKTGYRRGRGLIGSVRVYERIVARNPNYKPKDLIFQANHKDGLNELLKSCDMKFDSEGRVRNSKSFRTTYIMYRLIAKKTLKEIEAQCGTSAPTIQKYYAKYLDVDMFDDSFTDLPSDTE
jgi:integrase